MYFKTIYILQRRICGRTTHNKQGAPISHVHETCAVTVCLCMCIIKLIHTYFILNPRCHGSATQVAALSGIPGIIVGSGQRGGQLTHDGNSFEWLLQVNFVPTRWGRTSEKNMKSNDSVLCVVCSPRNAAAGEAAPLNWR
jgi:hypothetical protein